MTYTSSALSIITTKEIREKNYMLLYYINFTGLHTEGGGHWDTAQIILSKKTLFAITALFYDLQYIY